MLNQLRPKTLVKHGMASRALNMSIYYGFCWFFKIATKQGHFVPKAGLRENGISRPKAVMLTPMRSAMRICDCK